MNATINLQNPPAIVRNISKTSYKVAMLVPRGKEASNRAIALVNGLTYVSIKGGRHYVIDPKLVFKTRAFAELAIAHLRDSEESYFIVES